MAFINKILACVLAHSEPTDGFINFLLPMPQSVLFYAAVPLQTHPPNGERRPDGHVL